MTTVGVKLLRLSFKIGDNDPVSFESDGQNEITVDAGTHTITEPEVLGYLII